MKEVNDFKNIRDKFNLISRFFEEEYKSLKKTYNNLKKPNKNFNTIGSLIIIGSTSTSTSLRITRLGLIVVATTAGVGCGVIYSTKSASEILKKIQKYFLEKYTLENNNNIVQVFRKMYQKSWEDNIFDQSE